MADGEKPGGISGPAQAALIAGAFALITAVLTQWDAMPWNKRRAAEAANQPLSAVAAGSLASGPATLTDAAEAKPVDTPPPPTTRLDTRGAREVPLIRVAPASPAPRAATPEAAPLPKRVELAERAPAPRAAEPVERTTGVQPRHDLSGVYSAGGKALIVDQDGLRLTYELNNSAFNHRFSGRYTSPTTVVGIQTRTNRSNGCEARIYLRIDASDQDQICSTARLDPPGEAQCDLPGDYSEQGCAVRQR